MDNSTTSMHVIQAQQHLFCDWLDERHRHPFILMSFYQAQELVTKDLKDHADVRAIRTLVSEVIEE
jgi:hypothetical protein